MGTFGTGPFDNDDALDFLSDVAADGIDAVDRIFDDLMEEASGECIESDLCAMGVAAIEMVALAKKQKLFSNPILKTLEFPTNLEKKLTTKGRIQKAERVARIVVATNSELAQLWDQAGKGKAWRSRVERIAKSFIAD
ncbi:MAG: DUF4259 domain-containing protein [Pirellulaceae bacterium]